MKHRQSCVQCRGTIAYFQATRRNNGTTAVLEEYDYEEMLVPQNVAVIVTLLLATSACAQESYPRAVHSPAPATVQNTVTLEQVEEAVRNAPRISSFMLYRNGALVSEQHDEGHGRNQPINIKSASKSVLNALTGIAVQRGDLRNLDAPITEYLPQYASKWPANDPRRQITIRHLLTMSSGLPSTSIHNYGAWVSSRDWLAYALSQELARTPGSAMTYSTGDTHLLAAVLTKAVGMPLRSYAQRHLFDPLGHEISAWDRDPKGINFGGNNFAISPAALLAFGQLYLDEGQANGQQVLTPDWIQQSWTPRFMNSSFNGRHDYGYLWWHARFGGESTWFAWGYGGQFLFLLPDLEAAVVMTGDPDARSRTGNAQVYDVLERFIVPYLQARAAREQTS